MNSRTESIEKLTSGSFDVLVIGGGITGAGIALDAASRGLKTALIEKNDYAWGTSSRSTKLIHGGLRYLKQLEFGLVKEVGSERAIVHKLAPHLVIAEKMLLPLKEGRGFGMLLTSFGLKVYDWLAGVKESDQRKMLTRHQTLKHEPLLKSDGIKGGGLYVEYRTDDARLTLEIIKTAISYGAVIANYVEANAFHYTNDKVSGVAVTDHVTKESFSIHARLVVNATGPWVDQLREKDKSKTGKTLRLTKGVHIVVPRERLPVKQAIYFDVPDGRMIFAIPRGRTTYIGTTDTDYGHDIDNVATSTEDAAYLIDAVNDSFPTVNLSMNDIESSWAGLRPLIHEEGKSASALSRKDEIFVSPSGLVSIAGGKLTGYRKMAERVVNMVAERSGRKDLMDCFTDTIRLCENNFKDTAAVRDFKRSLAEHLSPFGLTGHAEYLVDNYGRQAEEVIRQLAFFNDADASTRLARAELKYGVEHEMIISILDFFIRRTGMLFFDMPRLQQVKNVVLNDMKALLGWDATQFQVERNKLDKEIAAAQVTLRLCSE
jgi:glycerol-3-phosphate dehydrogenase